jgi:hypothetical protein
MDLIIMKKFFCSIGLHWMKNHHFNFTDKVDGKTVYNADCECGKKWMVDSLSPITLFKVPRDHDDIMDIEADAYLEKYLSDINLCIKEQE